MIDDVFIYNFNINYNLVKFNPFIRITVNEKNENMKDGNPKLWIMAL